MSPENSINFTIANPLTVGLLNGASAFILDEKYYLDDNIDGRMGLINLIEKLHDMSREEITTGALNLYFRSNQSGIPDKTRKTIRVVLPEMRKFSSEVQDLVQHLLALSEERNFIIDHPFRPMDIGVASIQEARMYKDSLLETLVKILSIYEGIREDLRALAEIGDTYKPVINYAFFFLKRDAAKTALEHNINEIKSDFEKVFENLGIIIQFIDRLEKRINDLRTSILPETQIIEILSMDDF